MVTSLSSHQCGPGLNPRRGCLMWVEFVVGSLLCSESFFFWVLWFFPLLKTKTSKFQFNLERMDMFKRVSFRTPMCFVGKTFTIPLPPIKGAVLIFFSSVFLVGHGQSNTIAKGAFGNFMGLWALWYFLIVKFPRCLAVCLMLS